MAFKREYTVGCDHPLDHFGAKCDAEAKVWATGETHASLIASENLGWQACWVGPGDEEKPSGWYHYCPEHVRQ